MSEIILEKIAYITEKGNSGDLSVAGDIVRFLEDSDVQVRASACFYLGYLGAKAYIGLILNHLGSEDEEVTNQCLSGLALMIGESEGHLFEQIAPYIYSNSLLVKMSAVDALGAIGGSKSERLLLDVFDDNELSVKAQIVLALSKVGSAESLPALKSFLLEIRKMDYSVPRKGGVRGTPPHPAVLEHITLEAIKSVSGEG